ncbi:MAG: Spy/CpxP family protein refolding chaperone [Victivallaceae bacterium]|nr:Spy/CpxP family protein refolding chaperone [Victivallaceae bacterium]
MKPKGKLLVALLLAISGIAVNAQDDPPPDRPRGRGPAAMNIEELKTELKLSEEQCGKLKPVLDKIKSIFEAGRPQGRPDSQSGSKSGSKSDSRKKRGSRDEMKKKMQEMQTKILAALEPAKEFLSNEQYEKLKKKFTRPPRDKHRKRSDRENDSDNSQEFNGPPDRDDDL